MSYPDDSTHPITEWYIDGAWVDLSERQRAAGGPVMITRGRQNEQGTISPSTASYSMNNHDLELSNRNPTSTYYRKIPTGTHVRHRAGAGDNHAYLRYNTLDADPATSIRTPDAAGLDITGDIEIRVDIQPHTWRTANRLVILASKYLTTGGNRSWILYMSPAGRIIFAWTTDGINLTASQSTVEIPATSGRLAIKFTFDVNNGAGGRTMNFYTAPTINGTYTQLGTSVTVAGTTSIFSGTGAVVLSGGDNTASIFTTGVPMGGKWFGFHLYNGIGGTLKADPDFSTWDLEDTSNADAQGNTWSLTGQARITSPRVRFVGELTSSTQLEDKSANDKYVPVLAADILQRLGSGRVAPDSPLYLNIANRDGLVGYWPMEDGPESTSVATTVPGSIAGTIINMGFGQSAGLPGTKSSAELSSQLSRVTMKPKLGTGTGVLCAVWFFKMGSTLPSPSETTFAQLTTSGTARYVSFLIGPSTFGLQFREANFTDILDTDSRTFGTGVVVTEEWIAMRVLMEQNGANVDWEWAWYQQGNGTFFGSSGSYAGTVGYATGGGLSANGSSAFSGAKVNHFVIAEADLGFATTDTDAWANAIEAYASETAAERIDRIARGAGIYCEIMGEVSSSAALGAQPVDTPLNVMLDAARADGGILAGLRDVYGIGYRSRQDLERHIDASLTYSTHLAEVPEVIDDDQQIVNAFTASRTNGSSAYAEITDGYNSVSEPPDGQGPRPGGADFNVYEDSVLPDLANLRAVLGSYDSPRIPNLEVAFHRALTHPSTAAGLSVAGLDIGSTVDVTGWPAQNAPDRLSFLVQGYMETLARYLWSVRFNVSTAGPYRTGLWTTPDQPAGDTRYGSSDSTLNAGITSSATTIVIASTDEWTTTSARYPLDIEVGGEVITLGSAPTGGTSPQTFNGVTRSVNGIVKTHDAGARVKLAIPTYYGLAD